MKAILLILFVILSSLKVDHVYTGQPEQAPWGSPMHIRYDAEERVWLNDNWKYENWVRAGGAEEIQRIMDMDPERIPEKQRVVITFNPDLFWHRSNPATETQTAMAGAFLATKRRLKLINVEESINELRAENTESRTWPHLGLLYVGTVADQEGWDVTLHDELVEGYVDMERFVEPGDIVGLSLVVTGMDRGIELARQAKRLGASYVVVGNDSAIFRSDQVLQLPDRPIDAVFTTNGLNAVRQFLRQVGTTEIEQLQIPGVAVMPSGVNLSNEHQTLQLQRSLSAQLRQEGELDSQDVFVVPKLSLFTDHYWQTVWANYRTIFGHKHKNPATVRNALAMFAQGCSRAATMDVCSYCTIAGVADIRLPTHQHLEQLLEAYQSLGIDYVFNATDSALEMARVVHALKDVGAHFPEGLMIYGRAWGLANRPQAINEWLSLTGGRLLVNVGMDSGDERILDQGVLKASQSGSRLDENYQAVRNIAASGAHLHFSLIFGSPGETRETCEKSLVFFDWTRETLGTQLDQCETDIFWLNHGSPASRVFRDYGYAQELASLAGKTISRTTWEDRFHQHRDTLVVPWECEQAWYECFTSITAEEAQEYNRRIASAMAAHEGAAPGRNDMCRAFRPT